MATVADVGTTSIGGTVDTTLLQFSQVVKRVPNDSPGLTGLLVAIGVYMSNDNLDHVSSMAVGVFSELAGGVAFETLLSVANNTGSQNWFFPERTLGGPVPRWVYMPVRYRVVAGTPFWIGFLHSQSSGFGRYYYDAGGHDRVEQAGSAIWRDENSSSDTGRSYSIRGLVLLDSSDRPAFPRGSW